MSVERSIQELVHLAASEMAQEYNRSVAEDREQEDLAALRTEGCNIVNVSDITPWREACAALKDEFAAGYEDLYQQLLDFE